MSSYQTYRAKRVEKEDVAVTTISPNILIFNAIAAAVILMAAYYLFVNLVIREYTKAGQVAEVVLPDTSKVKLNANSQLLYKEGEWETTREVTLKGEAFFKVAKGQRFDVNTEKGVISVLGTEFNVESREGFFEVSCYEGSVNVNYQNENLKLTAGNSIMVIDGELIRSEVKANATPSWTNGESTFDAMPLQLVVNELERVYKVKLIKNGVDTNQKYSGFFTHDDLDGALESICIPLNIDYQVVDANRKVILSKK